MINKLAFYVRIQPGSAASTRKSVLNNLNYKVKALWHTYPHLKYYGNHHIFTFRTLANVSINIKL